MTMLALRIIVVSTCAAASAQDREGSNGAGLAGSLGGA
jgi:hypothetical protein